MYRLDMYSGGKREKERGEKVRERGTGRERGERKSGRDTDRETERERDVCGTNRPSVCVPL